MRTVPTRMEKVLRRIPGSVFLSFRGNKLPAPTGQDACWPASQTGWGIGTKREQALPARRSPCTPGRKGLLSRKKKKMRTPRFTSIALISVLGLGACAAPQNESESQYSLEAAMTSSTVERCRVLEVRPVSLGAEPVRSTTSGYGGLTDVLPSGPNAQMGALIGGMAVAAFMQSQDASYLASGVGAAIGSAVGSTVGSQIDRSSPSRRGYEYSVILATGEEQVIVQPYKTGDRIVPVNGSCRIVNSGGALRVMPADELPTRVARPAQTRFY